MPVVSERGQGKRADARRNISAILDAAQACLVADPETSIGEIAKRAGVGRVTLYGHFPSRVDLVNAVFTRAITAADDILEAVDIDGEPREALARPVASTWQIVHQSHALLITAQSCLPAERIHAAHAGPMRRIQRLIERGQRESVFRDDLPVSWLVALYHSVVHGAADEITAGRLSAADAAHLITATLDAAYTPPGAPVPRTR
jgi:TetR/AcrR family transcriptional regulator, mexCD-oprJ operon repressor